MNTACYPVAALPPIVLGVALTIGLHEGLRRSLHTVFGLRTRAINLRIDPSMDLIFLCEVTLPGTMACLTALTRPGIGAVTLRRAHLEWQPDPEHPVGRSTSTLAALESGSCFLTANTRKVPIASFSAANVHPTRVTMELQGRPNLLEYLRSDWFTLEISGTNRRRLTRPLGFSAVLEFDLQMSPEPIGTQ